MERDERRRWIRLESESDWNKREGFGRDWMVGNWIGDFLERERKGEREGFLVEDDEICCAAFIYRCVCVCVFCCQRHPSGNAMHG